jgi:hypothetical protein
MTPRPATLPLSTESRVGGSTQRDVPHERGSAERHEAGLARVTEGEPAKHEPLSQDETIQIVGKLQPARKPLSDVLPCLLFMFPAQGFRHAVRQYQPPHASVGSDLSNDRWGHETRLGGLIGGTRRRIVGHQQIGVLRQGDGALPTGQQYPR